MRINIPDTITHYDLVQALEGLGVRLTGRRLDDGSYDTAELPAAAKKWRETTCNYPGCSKVRPTVQLENSLYCAEHGMKIMQAREERP